MTASPRTTSRDLLALPPRRAVEVRYLEGRARHGPVWQGEHPLLEAYVELLDFGVYVDLAAAMGDVQPVAAGRLRAMCWPLLDSIREQVVRLESQNAFPRRSPRLEELGELSGRRWGRPENLFVIDSVVAALAGALGAAHRLGIEPA